jgi:hypothetical protein
VRFIQTTPTEAGGNSVVAGVGTPSSVIASSRREPDSLSTRSPPGPSTSIAVRSTGIAFGFVTRTS